MGQNIKDLLSDKEAILFDMDGTLVHSNDLHASAWAEALNCFGHDISAETVRPLIGKGGDKLLPELIGIEAESAEGKRIGEMRTKIFIEHYAPRIKAFPKAKELLNHLQSQGWKIVIATSASKEELTAILKAADLEGTFPSMTSADDAEASKPDPDILQAALRQVGVAADQAVMIGDTPYDIEASLLAHTPIIAFRCGGWSDEDFDGAIAVYDGPEEMLTELNRTATTSALQPTPWHGEPTF